MPTLQDVIWEIDLKPYLHVKLLDVDITDDLLSEEKQGIEGIELTLDYPELNVFKSSNIILTLSNEKCASCHVPTMQTGPSPIDSLNQVNVNIYSDFLLHDMGEELADNRPDGDATGREWRTAPLWGTRLIAEFFDGAPFFLHDGHATTLEGAIRAHGGEAQSTKEAFFNLSKPDQQAVITFLNSL